MKRVTVVHCFAKVPETVLEIGCKRSFVFGFSRYGREENSATVATYSRTVYVGNIGYCTTDRQIYEFFSRVGPVEVVHMGLNRIVSR
jgi:RNA recognition motif-containing protein